MKTVTRNCFIWFFSIWFTYMAYNSVLLRLLYFVSSFRCLLVCSSIIYSVHSSLFIDQSIQRCSFFNRDSGVGKSSIVQRFVKDTYHDNMSTTIGASFVSKTLQVENESFKFQIWDTAGEERYRGLAPMYYRNAGAAIIVYDITTQSTFDEIKVWVHELHRHGPENICIAIAGNKCDLEDLREVTEKNGATYASEMNAIFAETSAKTAKNVNEIFIEICKNLPPVEFGRDKQGVIQVDSLKKNEKKGCCE